jgi:hypothetical protein
MGGLHSRGAGKRQSGAHDKGVWAIVAVNRWRKRTVGA